MGYFTGKIIKSEIKEAIKNLRDALKSKLDVNALIYIRRAEENLNSAKEKL